VKRKIIVTSILGMFFLAVVFAVTAKSEQLPAPQYQVSTSTPTATSTSIYPTCTRLVPPTMTAYPGWATVMPTQTPPPTPTAWLFETDNEDAVPGDWDAAVGTVVANTEWGADGVQSYQASSTRAITVGYTPEAAYTYKNWTAGGTHGGDVQFKIRFADPVGEWTYSNTDRDIARTSGSADGSQLVWRLYTDSFSSSSYYIAKLRYEDCNITTTFPGTATYGFVIPYKFTYLWRSWNMLTAPEYGFQVLVGLGLPGQEPPPNLDDLHQR